MSDAQIIVMPGINAPTQPGLYVEATLAHELPYAPVYRLYESGGWWIAGREIPAAALPGGLAKLGVVA